MQKIVLLVVLLLLSGCLANTRPAALKGTRKFLKVVSYTKNIDDEICIRVVLYNDSKDKVWLCKNSLVVMYSLGSYGENELEGEENYLFSSNDLFLPLETLYVLPPCPYKMQKQKICFDHTMLWGASLNKLFEEFIISGGEAEEAEIEVVVEGEYYLLNDDGKMIKKRFNYSEVVPYSPSPYESRIGKGIEDLPGNF